MVVMKDFASNQTGKIGIGTDDPDSLLHVLCWQCWLCKNETRDGGTNPIIMHENPDRIWHDRG